MNAEFFDLDRRGLMQHMAMLLGAAALPTGAFAAVAKGTKRFLPAASYQILVAVADTIMPATDTPGAVGVGVPAKLDYMLGKWANAKHQQAMSAALISVDKFAVAQTKKGFAALTPAQRKTVLIAHEKAVLKPVPQAPGAPTGLMAMFLGGDASVVDPGYARVKDMIVSLYYNSKVAMTKEVIYEHVPGGWTPSIKTTPQTRPSAGTGPF